MTTTRITGRLPSPTLAQRIASMSTVDLMDAAKGLASDPKHDALCTAVLEQLEKRLGGEKMTADAREHFDAFLAEIFGSAS